MDHKSVIKDMINNVQNGENTEAEKAFNFVIADKAAQSIDQRRQEVANKIFNS